MSTGDGGAALARSLSRPPAAPIVIRRRTSFLLSSFSRPGLRLLVSRAIYICRRSVGASNFRSEGRRTRRRDGRGRGEMRPWPIDSPPSLTQSVGLPNSHLKLKLKGCGGTSCYSSDDDGQEEIVRRLTDATRLPRARAWPVTQYCTSFPRPKSSGRSLPSGEPPFPPPSPLPLRRRASGNRMTSDTNRVPNPPLPA